MRATGSVGVEHFFSLNTSACAASRSFAFPAREPIADEKSSDDRFDALQERELPRAHPARGPAARGWRALRPRVSRATPVTNRRQNQSSGEAAEKRRESRRQPRRRFRATPQHPGRRPHAARPAGAPGSGRTRAPTTALCEALREQVWIGAARRAETAVTAGHVHQVVVALRSPVPICPAASIRAAPRRRFATSTLETFCGARWPRRCAPCPSRRSRSSRHCRTRATTG